MASDADQSSSLRIAAFESRRAAEMARMIEHAGAEAFVSPSMREVAVDEDRPAIDFANRLITGQIDVVIFLTGVGVTQFVERIERHVSRRLFLDALSDVQTVVRGPKPVAALKALGVTPSFRAAEPNTWREILGTLDSHLPVANHVVGVLEYGEPNISLTAGLEARGATVESVAVYRWELPENTKPLQDNIQRLVDGKIDVAMFTSAQQVVHVLQVARKMKLEDAFGDSLRNVVIASIGPTTSEMLRSRGQSVDFEPAHAKMGHLVKEVGAAAGELLNKKRGVSTRIKTAAQPEQGSRAWDDSPFMRACRRLPTPYTPIWLMRQAGPIAGICRKTSSRPKTTSCGWSTVRSTWRCSLPRSKSYTSCKSRKK